MLTKLHNFFAESYRTSKIGFFAEIAEIVTLVIASSILAYTVLDPAMRVVVPLYLFGSIMSVISTYLRGSTAIVLCSWFVAMNTWAMWSLFIR